MAIAAQVKLEEAMVEHFAYFQAALLYTSSKGFCFLSSFLFVFCKLFCIKLSYKHKVTKIFFI
jgi:hypothetical protein